MRFWTDSTCLLILGLAAVDCGGGSPPPEGVAPAPSPGPAGRYGRRGGQMVTQAPTSPINVNAVYPTDFSDRHPLTRAERTGFLETSRYDDVHIFIDSLIALGARLE